MRWNRVTIGAVLALAFSSATDARAQALDVCGCTGSPASLGAFDSNDAATWPPGTTATTTVITIPLSAGANGVLIFDSFTVRDIPGSQQNGTVTFAPNAANDPVTLLVAGDVLIDTSDVLSVQGLDGTNGTTGAAGVGGRGGAGGFRGGGGAYQAVDGLLRPRGGTGLGPLGGAGFDGGNGNNTASPGRFLGVPTLVPMIGGSGGGGGGSSSTALGCSGGGGGGGGGAILIAANGTITVNGTIDADGAGVSSYGTHACSSGGGHGAGGAIRLVANAIAGSGDLFARGNNGLASTSDGATRMEAFTNTLPASAADPPASRSSAPGPIRNPFEPTVRISRVSGVDVSLAPAGITGGVDVIVPAPGPVTIDLVADGVPAGTNVEVTAKGQVGGDLAPQSVPLVAGDCTPAGVCGASAVFDMPAGHWFVEARATFTTN